MSTARPIAPAALQIELALLARMERKVLVVIASWMLVPLVQHKIKIAAIVLLDISLIMVRYCHSKCVFNIYNFKTSQFTVLEM